jgi:regulator of replication initiation timing
MPNLFGDERRDKPVDYKFEYHSIKNRFDEMKSQLDEIEKYIRSHADSHVISLPFELKKTIQKILEENNELRTENKELTNELRGFHDQFNQLKDKFNEIEATIDQKNKKITAYEKHNALMSELLDEQKSGWIIRRNLAIRTNPAPNEPNEFRFPLHFNEDNVYDPDSDEKNPRLCHFNYYPAGEYPDGKCSGYTIPWSLYEFLRNNPPVDNTPEKEINQANTKSMSLPFTSPEDLTQYFKETLGDKYYTYTRIDTITKFIFENIEKQFDLDDIGTYCEMTHVKKPSPATIYKHLNLLLKHDIIERKYRGKYEVNKQRLNFH